MPVSHVAIAGGGRWARVMLQALCSILPENSKVSIYSPHNASGMRKWAAEIGVKQQVCAYSDFPEQSIDLPQAMIVVNAAHNHARLIKTALMYKIPILVEKPLTLSYTDSKELVNLAAKQGTYFAAAHVFLFARYISNFFERVEEAGGAHALKICWADPQGEQRYGEMKSFDPGLTIHADWLPHIVSILSTVGNPDGFELHGVEVARGGARLKIDLSLDGVPCELELERNGLLRRRIIEVETSKGALTLNFSSEPGVISQEGGSLCGDDEWGVAERPVALMLRAFLKGVDRLGYDPRLDVMIGLSASRLEELVSSHYYRQQVQWLIEQIQSPLPQSDDVRYTLNEMVQAGSADSMVPLEQRVNYFLRDIKGAFTSGQKLGEPNSFLRYTRSVLERGSLTSYV